MEYILRISSLSATQFTLKSPISSNSQLLQFCGTTQFKLCLRLHTGKTNLENLAGELDATNIYLSSDKVGF